MAHDCPISQRVKASQERIFRLAARDHGLTLKAISLDSGLCYSTLRNYAGHNGEPSEMPVSALFKLIGVVPNELLSLLLPEAQAIVTVPTGIDHDELAEAAQDYLAAKSKAHHPDSEAGPAIGPNEHDALTGKAAGLRAVAA